MPKPKIRLDQLVVERGLAPTRSKAQAMILAGLVMIEDEVISKAGTLVSIEASVTLKEKIKYVSRGGIKLEGAIQHFKIDVTNMEILDVGASTGGFSDCLLQMGAKHLYAVDVGTAQLDVTLRNNPNVSYKESFHVKDLSTETFGKDFSFAVMDVSFISLKKSLPFVLHCLKNGGQILALIKPQFETQAKYLVKGVLKDEPKRQEIVSSIRTWAKNELNLQNIQTFDSTLKGPKGNQETFLYGTKKL